MYRSVLFTGCAADRDGAPSVYHATIALARALGLELWEAPASGCCGARPDRAVSAVELRHAFAPLGAEAHQGLDVVCLSPACCRVVATHVTATAPDTPAGGVESAAAAPQARDVVHVLAQADGVERLARAVRTPLASLRVAVHGTCHADHLPPAVATPGPSPEQVATRAQPAVPVHAAQEVMPGGMAAPAPAPRMERPTLSGEDVGLANLIATTGAMALPDVSVTGCCAAVHVRDAWIGPAPEAAPDVRCLALAAQNGADLVVTPCFLCFSDLNHYQRTLERADPARDIPVLHLSQVLGVACGVAPLRLDLARTTASARRVLAPFVA